VAQICRSKFGTDSNELDPAYLPAVLSLRCSNLKYSGTFEMEIRASACDGSQPGSTARPKQAEAVVSHANDATIWSSNLYKLV
jgi:hypothetical protein